MKKLIFVLSAIALIAPVTAQVEITYEIGQDNILPGDEVECFLVIKNPNPVSENLVSVVFYSNLISPRTFSMLGTIPPHSEYRLPFVFEAEKEGWYVIEVHVRTQNGTTKAYIPFKVEKSEPELILKTREIYVGEKNVIAISVLWDSAVKIKPLFNASPTESYGNDFEFTFVPEKPEKLFFEIEYKSGKNIHKTVKEVNPVWIKSPGVTLSVNYNRNVYSNEAVEVSVNVTNLKKSPIHSLLLSVGDKKKFLAELKPEEAWEERFYIQAESNKSVVLKYLDELGNKHEITKKLEFSTINESVVQICRYELEDGMLTGEVCNLGSTEVKNVIVRFKDRSYFIGPILPEDYEVFSLNARGNGTIEVNWRNMAGNVLKTSLFVEEEGMEIRSSERSKGVLYASAVIAVVIIAVAILAFRKR